MTPGQTKMIVDLLNERFFRFGPYVNAVDAKFFIMETLHDHNLDPSRLLEAVFINDEGRVNEEVGGLFVTVTWYRMSSGNFEVVAYAHSEFDNYYETYDVVLTGKERANARDKANKLLPTGNENFRSLYDGFHAIQAALKAANLDTTEFAETVANCSYDKISGRIHPTHVGNELYLGGSWYRTDSGRYEVIVYV